MIFRTLLGLLLGLVLTHGTPLAAAGPGYAIEVTPAQEIEATFTTTVRLPKFEVSEWTFIMAQPPELPCQPEVESVVQPEAVSVQEGSKWQRPVYLVTVTDPERKHDIEVSITYRATLMARRLVPVSARTRRRPVPPLTDQQREQSLENTETFDHEAEPFQQWLTDNKLRREAREADLAFAARAFRSIAGMCTYDYSAGLDRRSSAVCTSRKSDCAGLSALFVSTMRANDIPARTLAGRKAVSTEPGAKLQDRNFYGQHVRAEFYAEQIGWVPVEPTRALKDKSSPLKHFGNDTGDMLVIAVNSDYILTPALGREKTADWFQGMLWFYKGRGSSEGREAEYSWQVRVLREASASRRN